MTTELFYTLPVSGAFTGSIEGDRVGEVSFFGSASHADSAATASFLEGTIESASFAISASHAETADSADTATSASHALQSDNAATADFATAAGTAVSASHAVQADNAATAVSASHALQADNAATADFATLAATASFVTASNIQGVVESASFAETASFVLGSESASFAETASFATTASFAETAQSASLADKANVAPMNISLNNFFGAEMKLRVPVDITEQDAGQRTLASLLGYTQARVIVRNTQFPNTAPAGVIAVEGSIDDASFTFLCGGSAGAGDGAPSASLSGTIGEAATTVSPWCDITGTLAVEDVFLRWVTYSGSDAGANARPRVGSINLQVR